MEFQAQKALPLEFSTGGHQMLIQQLGAWIFNHSLRDVLRRCVVLGEWSLDVVSGGGVWVVKEGSPLGNWYLD